MTREVTKLDYEWDIEILDEYDDIIDHDFQDKFPGPQTDDKHVVVLVKSYARGLSGMEHSFSITDRTWAYMKGGELPEEFDDGSRVPKRFHDD
jgi:hypothetical protein